MENKNLPAEKQFFAVQGKGRQGLNNMVETMKDQMWATKPAWLSNSKKEVFFQKAIMNIANDEKLNVLTASKEGLYQIFLQLQKGVQLGMVPGGVRPQFYIVPRKKYENGKFKGQYIATFIPTQDGLRYAVTTGVNAVFKDVMWGVVRAGYDKFKIDEVNGIIEHEQDPIKCAKGEILGVWIRCTRINKDDIDVVKFVTSEKILSIRDKCSDAYKSAIKYNKTDSVWHVHPEEQYIKTAVKSVLKHYISQSEALSQLTEMEELQEQREANYNAQNVGDRMSDRLDDINNNADIEDDEIIPSDLIIDETPSEPVKKEKKTPPKIKETSQPNNKEKGSLF